MRYDDIMPRARMHGGSVDIQSASNGWLYAVMFGIALAIGLLIVSLVHHEEWMRIALLIILGVAFLMLFGEVLTRLMGKESLFARTKRHFIRRPRDSKYGMGL